MSVVPLGGAAAGMDRLPLGAARPGASSALTIERTTNGGVRVTCPDAPGWVATARTPVELARAITAGWREADVASYAQQRGEMYDLRQHDLAASELATDGLQLPADDGERESVVAMLSSAARGPGATSKRADPLAWQPQADGAWLSPSGRKYGAATQVVQRVVALRQEMGVGTG